jgi:SAM-dependent methyltransferase
MRSALRLRRSWQHTREAIEVRQGTAEGLPIGDGTIDGAWALNAMHHFDDLGRAADELRRVLRPTARLLLVDEDFNDSDHQFCGCADDDHGPGFVDPDAMVAHLVAVGFSDASYEHRAVGGAPAFVIQAHRGPGQGW